MLANRFIHAPSTTPCLMLIRRVTIQPRLHSHGILCVETIIFWTELTRVTALFNSCTWSKTALSLQAQRRSDWNWVIRLSLTHSHFEISALFNPLCWLGLALGNTHSSRFMARNEFSSFDKDACNRISEANCRSLLRDFLVQPILFDQFIIITATLHHMSRSLELMDFRSPSL